MEKINKMVVIADKFFSLLYKKRGVWLGLLFFFYLLLIFLSGRTELVADELRYAQFAENLSNGFYSPSAPNINLWNGPGYPIILWALHHALQIPFSVIRFANALFLALSVLFLFKSLLVITNKQKATIGSLALVLFYPLLQDLPSILTETFSVFLISWILFLIVKANNKNSLSIWLLLGLVLGLLSLTKVIFGYVVPVAILLAFVFSKWNKRMILTLLIWGLVVAPWLFYTNSITGKTFYWGNAGGMSLYWMSSPAPDEYGDWNNETFTAGCNSIQDCNSGKFKEYHEKDFEVLKGVGALEKDDEYKRIALKNISENPLKYIKNWASNWGRMLFGFPFSYTPFQIKTLVRFPSGIVTLLALVFCFVQGLIRWKHLRTSLKFLWFILIVYLGGSSLVSAFPRMMNVIIPVLIVLAIGIYQSKKSTTEIRNE